MSDLDAILARLTGKTIQTAYIWGDRCGLHFTDGETFEMLLGTEKEPGARWLDDGEFSPWHIEFEHDWYCRHHPDEFA